MSLYEEAKARIEEEKKAKEAKELLDFHEYKLKKMIGHIKETEKNAKELSLSDEKAKEIEAITFEQYKDATGGATLTASMINNALSRYF